MSTQANNSYNLDSLPGPKNQYSLESCIADCERGKYVCKVGERTQLEYMCCDTLSQVLDYELVCQRVY